MKRIIAMTAVLALCACATVHETYAPDGRKAYALNCSGMARGWDKCLSAAGEKCGTGGYDVLDRAGEMSAVAAGTSHGFGGGITGERSMVIACKPPSN